MLAVLTVRNRFDDPDMWWHLKTGEIIWNTHHIPTVDTYSYTTHNHSYVPHEWLAQLSIFGAYLLAGYSGMMLWLSALASLLFVGGYALCALYSGNAKVAFLGAMIIWLMATVGLAIRPQMIGYLFLIIELLTLHLGVTRSSKWFFALPFLFVVWVNCHGSFFLGMMIGGIALAGSFLEFRVGLLVSERWPRRTQTSLAAALALSVGALFVNPSGWHQVTYPLNTMFQQNLGIQLVTEWQPLDMTSPRATALLGITGLILLLPILRGVALRLDELLKLGLVVWLGVHHSRMVFVFGVIAAPIVCRLLRGAWENYDFERDRIRPNLVAIAASVVAITVAFPRHSALQAQVDKGSPVKAIQFIKRAALTGNMLNDYTFGGYIIWAAPEHKVFVDGRADVFEWTGVLADYGSFITMGADPDVLLRKYDIKTCIFPTGNALARVLKNYLGWTSVYSDDIAEVLVQGDFHNQ